jgi:steroid 5-alpha reductase family enzyme
MRALAVIVLSMIVIVAAIYCFIFSACAISGQGIGGSLGAADRAWSALAAIVALGTILGLTSLIGKLTRRS